MRGLVRYRRPSSLVFPEVEDFFKGMSDVFSSMNREFPLDMYEENGNLVVSMDAPGVDPDKVDIRVFPDRVTLVSREEQEERPCEEGKTWHCKKQRKVLNYSVSLPREVDPEGAEAEIKHGIITVKMPKKGTQEGKVLELKKGDA